MTRIESIRENINNNAGKQVNMSVNCHDAEYLLSVIDRAKDFVEAYTQVGCYCAHGKTQCNPCDARELLKEISGEKD